MTFALPFAFAGAGGLLTGWASWGIAGGWLIGSWLFGPSQKKNNVFDPGAQEMPRINQALRGSTMFVLFGTNRVPSNVVWQKNFTTIRHEDGGGGGGKFGGSGFGAKGGGATSISYEYKWDLMFHIGMSPEPLNLYGAWLGSDPLDDNSINGIRNGQVYGFAIFRALSENEKAATITYDEAFFGAGGATGDGNFDNWDYFEAQEGVDCRWPYTTYVGFKQLDLGSSPAVPQFNWELGPGSAEVTHNSGYIGKTDGISVFHDAMPVGQFVVDENGKHWVAFHGEVTSANGIFCLETASKITLLAAQFDADCTAAGLDPGGIYTFTTNVHAFNVSGTNQYFMVTGMSLTGGVGGTATIAFLLYAIVGNALVPKFGYAYRIDALASITRMLSAGLATPAIAGDKIIIAYYSTVSTVNTIHVALLPGLATFASGPSQIDISVNAFDARSINLTTILGNNTGQHASYIPMSSFGWILPTVDISDPMNPIVGTRYYMFFGKADVQKHIDDPTNGSASSFVNAMKTTYPNGFIGYIDLKEWAATGIAPVLDGFVVANDDFVNSGADAVAPFDDDCENKDGTANTSAGYYDVPGCSLLTGSQAAGAYVIPFVKRFASTADLSPLGTYSKVRGFLYNPLSQKFLQVGTGQGDSFDTVADAGQAEINRYNYTTYAQFVMFDEATGDLIEVRATDSADAGLSSKLVGARFGELELGGGSDYLPPYIIRLILTSPVFGIGKTDDEIDEASYALVLQYCDAENIRVSTIYTREDSALQVIELLLSLYGGFLTDSGGIIKFGKQEFSSNPVRTIDNSHLVTDEGKPPVEVVKGALQDSANKVRVNYIDRALAYRQNQVEVADEVDMDLNGVRMREFPPQFVMKEELANKLAIRALWSNLWARDQYKFQIGPKDMDLEPGDVITLVDSFHPQLSGGVYCRITSKKETKPGIGDMTGVKELQEYNASSVAPNSSTSAGSSQLFGPARAPANFGMYELPVEYQANPTLFAGYNQLNFAMGARLYVSPDGITYARVQDVQPFIISGIFAGALPAAEPYAMNEGVEVFLFPDTRSGFTASSPVYVCTHQLDDVTEAGRALGAGLIWCGSEMLAYENVTLIGQNHYRLGRVFRGWGGTPPGAHNSGDFWWKHGGGIFSQEYTVDKIGVTISYKIAPYNFSGVEYDISSIDARTYTIQGTYYRPQIGSPIRTFIDTPISGVGSDDIGGLRVRAVTSGGTQVRFDWPDVSQVDGFGQGGYGKFGYGHFNSDLRSAQFRVEVMSKNGAVVRSTSVGTSYYEYSLALNSADFNGWKGEFVFKVTPYNQYGDALRSSVKSLGLF